jgi:hypothetical protein
MIIEELETEEQTIEAAARRKFANEIRDKTMGEWEVTVLIDGKTYVDTDDYPDPHTKIDSAVFLRSNELLAEHKAEQQRQKEAEERKKAAKEKKDAEDALKRERQQYEDLKAKYG